MRNNKTKSSNKKGGSYPPNSPYTPVPLAYNPYNPTPQSQSNSPYTPVPLAYNPYNPTPQTSPQNNTPINYQPSQYSQTPHIPSPYPKSNITLQYNVPGYQYLYKPTPFYDYDYHDSSLSKLISKPRKTSRRNSKTVRKTSKRKMSKKNRK